MAISKQHLWVAGGVVLVGVILLSGEREDGQARAPTPAPACEVVVTADVLNVRNGAGVGFDVVDRLRDGDTVEATPTVRSGFRRLAEGRWAATRFLAVTEGSVCS